MSVQTPPPARLYRLRFPRSNRPASKRNAKTMRISNASILKRQLERYHNLTLTPKTSSAARWLMKGPAADAQPCRVFNVAGEPHRHHCGLLLGRG